MFISLVFARLAAVFSLLAIMKLLSKMGKKKKMNSFFGSIHIPFGALALVFGLIHGIFAGNAPTATINNFTPCAALFTFNWGTASLICLVVLAASFLFKKKLGKMWFRIHRIASALLVFTFMFHLGEV